MENQFQSLLSHFYKFAKSYLGLNRGASINFVSDPINSADVLGKTAHYDPNAFAVTVYVDGRHPKDILRSIAHELVHHRQNCQGKMDQPSSTEPGYAQNDPHLRGLEREAYLVGNMCFRDWEDKYKANREVKTIYESTIRNFIKEKINMKSNDELRNTVKEAVTKVLNKRVLKEFDRYEDEFASDEDDSYFADLANEFPDMGFDDAPAGAEPEAPADIKADMEDEFGSKEEPEEDLEEMFDSQEEMDKYLQDTGQMKTGTELGKEEEDKNEALAEGDEASRTITQIERIGDEISRIAKMSIDPAVIDRVEMIDDMITDVLARMQDVEPAGFDADGYSKMPGQRPMEEKSTDKHNDNPALTGDQKDELPDNLQKAIIDKEEETNEASMYPTEALIDILKTDPEFDLLASRADDVMANMKSGMTDMEALEAAYPDWVPGQLLHAALQKAKSEHSIPNRAIAEEEVVAEDFYTQLRKDARTISEDWNKSIKNKRNRMLNERLMKAWKLTK